MHKEAHHETQTPHEPDRLGPKHTLVFGAVSALALLAWLAPAAQANLSADVWTTYGSPGGSLSADMSSCRAGVAGLGLNDACYGLQNGQALGLIRALQTVDDLDQGLNVPYDDEASLPSPESPTNGIVRVWNGDADYTFLAAENTSFGNDAEHNRTIYFVPPGAELSGPTLDAREGDDRYKVELKLVS